MVALLCTGLGQEIDDNLRKSANRDRENALRSTAESVWAEAQAIKEAELRKALNKAQADHDKAIRKMQRAHEKAVRVSDYQCSGTRTTCSCFWSADKEAPVTNQQKQNIPPCLQESALRVEGEMRNLVLERVQQEREAAEIRQQDAIRQVQQQCQQELAAAVQHARQEERQEALNSAARLTQ